MFTICSIKGSSFGSKDYTKEPKVVEYRVWARQAGLGQSGHISDPSPPKHPKDQKTEPKIPKDQ